MGAGILAWLPWGFLHSQEPSTLGCHAEQGWPLSPNTLHMQLFCVLFFKERKALICGIY